MRLVRLTLRLDHDLSLPFLHGRIIHALIRNALGLPDSERFPPGLLPWGPESGRTFYPAGAPYALGLTVLEPGLLGPLVRGMQRQGSDRSLAAGAHLAGNFSLEALEDLVAGRDLPPGREPLELGRDLLERAGRELAGRSSLALRFVSPLRLARSDGAKRRGHGFCDAALFEAPRLLANLITRCTRLAPDLVPSEPPGREMALEAAAQVRHLLWLDLPKPGRGQTTGGVQGEVEITRAGGLEPWAPYLVLGQYLAAGSGASFGFGHYRLLRPGAWPPLPSRAETLARAAALGRTDDARTLPEPVGWREDWDDPGTEPEWPDSLLDRAELDELARGARRPAPLKGAVVVSEKGKPRALAIPSPVDQALQRKALEVLAPAVDELLETSSFAFRRGLSRKGAATALRRAYDQGLRFVLRADISAFFDCVDWRRLRLKLAALWDDDPLVDQLMRWVRAPVRFSDRVIERGRGLPQGAVLSPLLSNLFLDEFDEAVEESGFKLVRYADDFVICCQSREQVEKAREAVRGLLAGMDLELNPAKVQLTHFDDGFSYLGYVFCRSAVVESAKDRQPPRWLYELGEASPEFWQAARQSSRPGTWMAALDLDSLAPLSRLHAARARRASSPAARARGRTPLYIASAGSKVRVSGGRLTVSSPDTDGAVEVPLALMGSLVCLGHVHLDAYAIKACLWHQVPVYLCTATGALVGQATAPGDLAPATTVAAQVDLTRDGERCLAVARELVAGKIAGCRLVLRRQRGRDRKDDMALAELKEAQQEVMLQGSPEALRGLEGRAAAIYFDRLACHLPAELGFEARSGRPAADPVNAMLNFCYTLLYRQVSALLLIERLNPHLGVYHRPSDYYHPLASDIMEEFRYLADLVVLRLIHLGQVAPGDFHWREKPPTGWRINKAVRTLLVRTWQERMEAELRPDPRQPPMTLRGLIHRQVRRFKQMALRPDQECYQAHGPR